MGILAGLIGVLFAESSEKVALFYSLAGLFLALNMFMYNMFFAGAVALLSAAGGGVALMLFGGAIVEE
ncbi:MAG: hypothetical protein GOV00_03350 [Candidatus Altiarchaeota archaeon]|nr:hypothetical protein [Candidatus Altiarchaeota archaeon]